MILAARKSKIKSTADLVQAQRGPDRSQGSLSERLVTQPFMLIKSHPFIYLFIYAQRTRYLYKDIPTSIT